MPRFWCLYQILPRYPVFTTLMIQDIYGSRRSSLLITVAALDAISTNVNQLKPSTVRKASDLRMSDCDACHNLSQRAIPCLKSEKWYNFRKAKNFSSSKTLTPLPLENKQCHSNNIERKQKYLLVWMHQVGSDVGCTAPYLVIENQQGQPGYSILHTCYQIHQVR